MPRRKGFTLIELLVVIAIIAILASILFPMLTRVQEKGKQTKCMSNMRQLALAMMNYSQDANGALPNAWPSNSTWVPSLPGAPPNTWRDLIRPYIKSMTVLNCTAPAVAPNAYMTGNAPVMSKFNHYGLAVGLTHAGMSNPGFLTQSGWFGFTYMSKVQKPSQTIMVAENTDGDWSVEPMTTYGGHWDSGAGQPGGFYPYHLRQSSNRLDYTGGGNFIFCDGHALYMGVNAAEGWDPVTKTRSYAFWLADRSYNLPPQPSTASP